MKLHLLRQEGDCDTLGLMGKLAILNPESYSVPFWISDAAISEKYNKKAMPVVLSNEFNYQFY